MTILVDMDEVLVDLVTKWIWYYNSINGTHFKKEWITKYGDLGGEKWIEILRIPGFSADLPWLDSKAPRYLRRLRDAGHRIVVVTSPAAWESARDKYSWVHTHMRIPGIIDGMKDFVLARDKSLIRGDVLIDDNPSHLQLFPGEVICYDQPWNRALNVRRAHNWKEVYKLINELDR